MTLEIPERLEVALKQHAAVRGISPDRYVREMLEPIISRDGRIRSSALKTIW